MGPPLHCPRCADTVPAIHPWWAWRPLFHVWKVGFILVLCLLPFLASDYCVMLPCTMLYLTAGGLLRGYSRELPVCARCSLELDPDARPSGT